MPYFKNLTTGLVWKIDDESTIERVEADANYTKVDGDGTAPEAKSTSSGESTEDKKSKKK